MSLPTRPLLTIYRRPGCTLCDEAESLLAEELEARAARGELTPIIAVVDVSSDSALEARYGSRVPVFAVADDEIGPVISQRRLRAFLERLLPVLA